MAGVIKRVACEQLLAFLENAVPALVGKTHVAPAPPTTSGAAIQLAAIPHKFELDPFQADSVYEPTTGNPNALSGTEIDCIGEVNGTIELQLLVNNDIDREAIEDAINHAFYSADVNAISSGVIVINLPSVQINGSTATGYTPSAAFIHSGEDWTDEYAFSNRRWRMLDVQVTFPALVARTVNVIQNLYSEYADDLAATIGTESVQIMTDGSTVKEF